VDHALTLSPSSPPRISNRAPLSAVVVDGASAGTAQGLPLPTVKLALAPVRCIEPMLRLSSAELVRVWAECATDGDIAGALGARGRRLARCALRSAHHPCWACRHNGVLRSVRARRI
jgi:hypothetical protein